MGKDRIYSTTGAPSTTVHLAEHAQLTENELKQKKEAFASNNGEKTEVVHAIP